MYKTVLVATDGTENSLTAIRDAVALAASLGASLVGVHVAPPLRFYAASPADAALGLEEDYERSCREAAEQYLEQVQVAAEAADVPCTLRFRFGEEIADGILGVAAEDACDVLVMASRGRGNLASLLLGSETRKVLSHARLPVLVVR
ncbi:universal stress protein [Oleiagrimonas sp.]|jgi:nucleotide-binding universal stress UspA family protein|uniref:universal stress protein n=1 Tax=Oleiagrimonas sp. TaxID=2010330 RepID=UPI00261F5B8D|nr:universal stress protein [Oleiagrimonas sp.]MDA3913745.1 universal stress protein [Oleiagrimonas sp.]